MTSYVLVPVEPVAWMVVRPGDDSHYWPKLFVQKADADALRRYVNVHPPCNVLPLYAARPAVPEEVVERVAEALWEADSPLDPWEHAGAEAKYRRRKMARAAIQALSGEVADG